MGPVVRRLTGATFWAAALGWRRTHVYADGGVIVMADVEGNEFCVLRPLG